MAEKQASAASECEIDNEVETIEELLGSSTATLETIVCGEDVDLWPLGEAPTKLTRELLSVTIPDTRNSKERSDTLLGDNSSDES